MLKKPSHRLFQQALDIHRGAEGYKYAYHLAILPVDPETYAKTLADKARSIREAPLDRAFKGQYRSIRMLEAICEE